MIPLNNTVLTPKFSESTKDETKLKTGTTTVGLVCKDCIVLAADKRATAGSMIVQKDTKKVMPVTEHIAVTWAGSVSDLQLLYKYLSAELKLKQIRGGRETTVKEAANLLSNWVYHLIRSSYGVAHFLMGGYDSQPRLFDIYPDGSLTSTDEYVVSGSGSVFALGVLENKYKKGLSKEEGVALVLEAINSALARDSGSGNGIDVYVVDKNGVKLAVSKIIDTRV
ncbi:proteasome subunit beta [Candidatus Woesearchaeota archaeon]|nr:proteasome subunit beta [Candidatus Woesearchaeota archaeon]